MKLGLSVCHGPRSTVHVSHMQGVNDIITPDGVGENTFLPENIKRANKDYFGDVRKAQNPQDGFQLLIKIGNSDWSIQNYEPLETFLAIICRK